MGLLVRYDIESISDYRFQLLTCWHIPTDALTMLEMACPFIGSLVKVTRSSVVVKRLPVSNMFCKVTTDGTFLFNILTQRLIINQRRFRMETDKALFAFNIYLCKRKRNMSPETQFACT